MTFYRDTYLISVSYWYLIYFTTFNILCVMKFMRVLTIYICLLTIYIFQCKQYAISWIYKRNRWQFVIDSTISFASSLTTIKYCIVSLFIIYNNIYSVWLFGKYIFEYFMSKSLWCCLDKNMISMSYWWLVWFRRTIGIPYVIKSCADWRIIGLHWQYICMYQQ